MGISHYFYTAQSYKGQTRASFTVSNPALVSPTKIRTPASKVYLIESSMASDQAAQPSWEEFSGAGKYTGLSYGSDEWTIMDYAKGRHNASSNVSFLDGHVEVTSGAELKRKAASGTLNKIFYIDK